MSKFKYAAEIRIIVRAYPTMERAKEIERKVRLIVMNVNKAWTPDAGCIAGQGLEINGQFTVLLTAADVGERLTAQIEEALDTEDAMAVDLPSDVITSELVDLINQLNGIDGTMANPAALPLGQEYLN